MRIIEWRPPQQLLSQPRRQRELTHHFATSTSLKPSLLEVPRMEKIWQHEIPHEAQAHDFLLHGILGFAALHLSHLHGPNHKEYHMIACQQHAKASDVFQVAVSNVNVENCTAVCTFSLIMAMCQFDASFNSGLLKVSEQFDSLLNALMALRGAFHLTMQNRSLVEQGPLGILLTHPRNLVESVLDPETSRVLENLESINQSTTDTKEAKGICSEAIRKLQHWYSLVSLAPRTWAHVIQWAASISSEFFSFLRQRRSMALVILAHWCIPFHHAPYRWFVEGWAKRAVWVIANSVDVAYNAVMEWPLRQVGWIGRFEPGTRQSGAELRR